MNQCNTLRCDGDQEACDFPSAKNDRWMNGNCTGVSSGPSQLYGCEAPKGEQIDITGSTHRESIHCLFSCLQGGPSARRVRPIVKSADRICRYTCRYICR